MSPRRGHLFYRQALKPIRPRMRELRLSMLKKLMKATEAHAQVFDALRARFSYGGGDCSSPALRRSCGRRAAQRHGSPPSSLTRYFDYQTTKKERAFKLRKGSCPLLQVSENLFEIWEREAAPAELTLIVATIQERQAFNAHDAAEHEPVAINIEAERMLAAFGLRGGALDAGARPRGDARRGLPAHPYSVCPFRRH